MLGVDQPANRAFKKSFLPAAQIFLCGDPILKLFLFSCRCHPPPGSNGFGDNKRGQRKTSKSAPPSCDPANRAPITYPGGHIIYERRLLYRSHFEAVTKLVSSAKADSGSFTLNFPALPCWAIVCRRCATGALVSRLGGAARDRSAG